MRVNVVCRNMDADRVIPRFARYLADRLGWTLTRTPEPGHDVTYLAGYFEAQVCTPWPAGPVAAYFTHREEATPAKARLFDGTAERVQLRVATALMYAEMLEGYGPTVQVRPPVERERFVIAERSGRGALVAGFSGFTYSNGRKGEDLAKGLVQTDIGKRVEWMASGRGWPVKTRSYSWAEMPSFYQGLDVLVCTALVEGVPMPPLEALSCGVSVVIPRGVGLLDELPDVPGIVRYERGNPVSLMGALTYAVEERGSVDPEALRAVTEPFTVEAWCEGHAEAMERICESENGRMGESADGGIGELLVTSSTLKAGAGKMPGIGMPTVPEGEGLPEVVVVEPVARGTGSTRGIYCVAFGEPARESCRRMMASAKVFMPEVPICLCAAEPLGIEDVFVEGEDSDIGGRRAKLMAYENAPAEWETVLYLDADTEVVAPIMKYFAWVEDGWELAICKDIYPNDVLGHIRHKVHGAEALATEKITGTWDVLQLNGGAWSFRRCEATAAFFLAWRREWERWAQRDQGALIRALYTHPLRLLLLGNEWNTFPKFQPEQATAGLLHFPGEARRWTGQIRSRLDDAEAWAATERFERRQGRA